MRKSLHLASLALVLLTACGGTENVGDKLTPDEILYLRQRAMAQCKVDTETDLYNYIKTSNDLFGTSQYARNRTWKYEYKLASETASKTYKITSWKQDPNNLYFIMTIDDGGNAIRYEFLKITKAENQKMIEEMRDRYCDAKSNTATQSTVSFSSSSASVQIAKESNTTPTERQKITDRFTFDASLPAFFGTFKQTRTTETINRETDVISSTKKYTGTLTSVADEAPIVNIYTGYASAGYEISYTKVKTISATYNYDIPYTTTPANTDPSTGDFKLVELCRVDVSNCSF